MRYDIHSWNDLDAVTDGEPVPAAQDNGQQIDEDDRIVIFINGRMIRTRVEANLRADGTADDFGPYQGIEGRERARLER